MEFHKIVRNFSRLLQLVFYLFLFISYLNTGPFFFSFCFSILSPFFSTIQTTDYIVACRFDWKIFSLERAFYGWKVATINLFIFLFYSLTLLFFCLFFHTYSSLSYALILSVLAQSFQTIVETRYNFFFLCFFSAFLQLEKEKCYLTSGKKASIEKRRKITFFPQLQYFSSFFSVAVVSIAILNENLIFLKLLHLGDNNFIRLW